MRRLLVILLLLLSLASLAGGVFAVLSLSWLEHWFAQPWALNLLALLPGVLAFLLWNAERSRQALARLGNALAIESLLTVRRGLGALRGAVLLLGLLFLGLGVAGPQWGRDWQQTAAPGRDLIVVLDCSRSMFAEKPSRFERARKALLDLCNEIEKRGGHRLGLVVFAGKAELACPLTHDYDHFRATLEDLDPGAFPAEIGPGETGVSGTRIGAGLALAVESLDERFPGASDILLLSDGDDPAGDEEWRLGIMAAKEKNIPVYVVGIGDPNEASPIPNGTGALTYASLEVRTRLEEALLPRIAHETHGLYIPAHTRGVPLGTIYLDTIATLPVRQASVDALPLPLQRYVWFLLPAFVFFAAAVALPERLPNRPRRRIPPNKLKSSPA